MSVHIIEVSTIVAFGGLEEQKRSKKTPKTIKTTKEK